METHVKRLCLIVLLLLLVVIFGLSVGVVAEEDALYCLSDTVRVMSLTDDSFIMCDGKVRWDREIQTLTLDNVSIETSEAVAIILPNSAHLRIVGDCVIRCVDDGTTAKGIMCASDIRQTVLYVDGPGHLSVEMAGGYGLFMKKGCIVFDGVSVEAYSPRCGIYAAEMRVLSSSDGNAVRILGKSGADGTGLYIGSFGLTVNAACGSVSLEGNAGKTGISINGDADIVLGKQATVALCGTNNGILEAPSNGVGLSISELHLTAAIDAVLTLSGRNVSGTGIKLGSLAWGGDITNAQILIEEAGMDESYLELERIFDAGDYAIDVSEYGLHKITRRKQGHKEHIWDSGKTVLEPSCLSPGERVFVCVECSAEKKEEIPALGHEFVDKFESGENGHAKLCTRDGCGYKSNYEPHHGGKAACTEAAICEVCGVQYGDVLGHEFGNRYVCDENGHALICIRDDCNFKSEYEPHHSGKATCTEKATCEVCGVQYGDVLGHKFGNRYICDENGHTLICTRDDCGFKSEYEPHSGGTKSCTEAAICEVCGMQYGDVLGHKFESRYVCDENGHALVCTRDGCGYKSNYEPHYGGKATCTEKATCEVCGMPYGDVLGHKFESRYVCDENGHALVCTRDGCNFKSEYEPHYGGTKSCTEAAICEVCGMQYGDVLGHKFGNRFICDENGHALICTRDGCGYKSKYESHHGGKATCDEKATCEVCGMRYGDVLGHEFGNCYVCDENGHALICIRDDCNFKSEYEPHYGGTKSCTEAAICEVCGMQYGDVLGHKFGNRYICDENGHTLICTRDDCGFKSEYEPHSGGTKSCTEAAICEVCGMQYGDVLGHKFESRYVCDENGHALVCTRDGCGYKSNYEPHYGGKASCTEKATCEVCGVQYGKILGHWMCNDWMYNAKYHWRVCRRAGCGYTSPIDKHDFVSGMCVCGAKGTVLPGQSPEQSWQIFFEASSQYMNVEEDVREELDAMELPSEMVEQMVQSLAFSKAEGLEDNLDADFIWRIASQKKALYDWLLRQGNNQVAVSLQAFLDLIDVKCRADAELTSVTIDISPILCFDAAGETIKLDIDEQEVFAPVKVVLDLSFLQMCPDRLVHVRDDGTKSILRRDDENGFVYDENTRTAVFYVTSFSTFVVECDTKPTEEVHYHRMGKKFAFNSDCHWRICRCGVISYKGPHRFVPMVEWSEKSGEGTTLICSVCGYCE